MYINIYNVYIYIYIYYIQNLGCACHGNYMCSKLCKYFFMYPCLQIFSNFYCQFIDDIFLLWNGSETQLLDYITRLNSRHPTIKFDFKYSKSSIEFLDTKIYKNKEKNKLLTTIYRKPTDRRNFLDTTLAHP